MRPEINYSPLKHFPAMYWVYIWVKRAPMILVRLAVLAGFVYLAVGIVTAYNVIMNAPLESLALSSTDTTTTVLEYECGTSDGQQLCPWNEEVISQFIIPGIVLYFVAPPVVLWLFMAGPWRRFARRNKLSVENNPEKIKEMIQVPSFKKHLSGVPTGPIVGERGGIRFMLFVRMYKEGGILRWRERKMDTILRLEVPQQLPHIVINARANEKARRSNMSSKIDGGVKFQFEGTSGAHYDAYAAPGGEAMAFNVFSPDVLSVLYSQLPMTDVEVDGSHLWFVQRYTVLNDKTAKKLFESAFALYAKIAK